MKKDRESKTEKDRKRNEIGIDGEKVCVTCNVCVSVLFVGKIEAKYHTPLYLQPWLAK